MYVYIYIMLLNEYNVWHNFYLNKTAFTDIINSPAYSDIVYLYSNVI